MVVLNLSLDSIVGHGAPIATGANVMTVTAHRQAVGEEVFATVSDDPDVE